MIFGRNVWPHCCTFAHKKTLEFVLNIRESESIYGLLIGLMALLNCGLTCNKIPCNVPIDLLNSLTIETQNFYFLLKKITENIKNYNLYFSTFV